MMGTFTMEALGHHHWNPQTDSSVVEMLHPVHVPPEGMGRRDSKRYQVFFPNKQKFNLNLIKYLNVSSD